MFGNALEKEVDFFGTPIMNNFMKEATVAAAATYGGAVAVDSALEHHFFHLPFLDQRDYRPTLGLNPALQAAMTTWHYRNANDDSFLLTDFYQNWLGGGGLVPQPLLRAYNITTKKEAPEIYGTDNLALARYFFSVPSYSAYHQGNH